MSFGVACLEKAFGPNRVLRGVTFQSRAKRVHALLGANGAGKSTLIKCLSGAHAPDQGMIELDGHHYAAFTPASAQEAGAAVIYQNLSLVDSLSIAENIFLGRELRRGPFVWKAEQRRRAEKVLQQLLGNDHGLDVDQLVEELPIATRQIIEIAKALAKQRIRLLILDEPTAALSEREASRLKSIVLAIAARGVHVLFITHTLSDVYDICDQITVLRDGVVSLDEDPGQVSIRELTQAITGKLPVERVSGDASLSKDGECLLRLSALSGERFDDVSFVARRGEVIGIFGLVGSGRSELLETLFGARSASAGQMDVADRADVRFPSPADAIAQGVALVPGERHRQAVFSDLTALENMLQPAFPQLASGIWRNRAREHESFDRSARSVSLVPNDAGLAGANFSGGNLQKIILARWAFAFQGVKVLLLDEPTQGIDIGARADIYNLLRSRAVLSDRTIVFTTADPDEAALLADRVLVLCRGRIIAELDASNLDRRHLLDLAHSNGQVAGV